MQSQNSYNQKFKPKKLRQGNPVDSRYKNVAGDLNEQLKMREDSSFPLSLFSLQEAINKLRSQVINKLRSHASLSLNYETARRGFDALKENGQVVLRTWTGVFEKVEGDRSLCHGCRGSGLLIRAGLRDGDQGSPCWFCLGIGVLPVLDLEGFLIARSPALFHTTELSMHTKPSVKMHLYLGKFPGARCQLGASQLPREAKELAFSPPAMSSTSAAAFELEETPDSLFAAQVIARVYRVQRRKSKSGNHRRQVPSEEAVGQGRGGSSRRPTSRSSRLPEGTPPSLSRARRVQSNGTVQSVDHKRITSSTSEAPKPREAAGRHISATSDSVSVVGWNREESTTHGDARHREPGPVRGGPAGVWPNGAAQGGIASHRDLSATSPASWQSEPGHRRAGEGSRSPMRGPGGAEQRSPQLRSPPTRSPRRERNRIREKAQREAMERTRRRARVFSPTHVDESEGATSLALESSRPFSERRWEGEPWLEGKKPVNGSSPRRWQALFGRG